MIALCVQDGIAVVPPPISGTLQPAQICSFCKFAFVHWNIVFTPMHIPQLCVTGATHALPSEHVRLESQLLFSPQS
jgi:hypothetical protein